MKRVSIKPNARLIQLFCLPLILAFAQSFLQMVPADQNWALTLIDGLNQLWPVLITAFIIVAAYEYISARKEPALRFERQCQDTVSLHRWANMSIKVNHQFDTPVTLKLKDLTPESLEVNEAELICQLEPDNFTTLEYQLRPNQRGDAIIAGLELVKSSPLALWQTVWRADSTVTLKVYPDFKAISGYQLLATDNQVSQLGIKRNQKRGEGMEFHQLREYQRGDTSRQIDWKATARKQKIISRDYQDERDQQIVVLLDNGRRMRSEDNQLGHLDHSVNAMALLSHIALKQGDAVGLMSFGADQRWLPCKKGSAHINNILNHVYDLQPDTHATDYSGAAQKLLALQRKRSLVILITNTRDEDIEDLMPAIKLVSKNHLIMLANIREPILQQTLEQPVDNIEQVYRYCGTIDYLGRRKEVKQRLSDAGVFIVDSHPEHLAIDVCNSYLEIKSSGYL